MAEVKTHLKYFRVAPRKVRLVANLIKGLAAGTAVKQLMFSRKGAAPAILKLLKSAMANAKNNFRLDPASLYVKKITVNQGPTFKRHMPRARGRATIIHKRTSHITIVLDEKLKKRL